MPVFHHKPERVINQVRICFLAYWISARLARQWRQHGETGEVTRILRELQTIRIGTLHLKNKRLQVLKQITKVPAAELLRLRRMSGNHRILEKRGKAVWLFISLTRRRLGIMCLSRQLI